MIRTARKEDAGEIVSVLDQAFKRGLADSRRKYEQELRGVSGRIDEWRVLITGAKLAGCLHIGRDWLRIGKARILKGDVGEVAVRPECQGAGCGSDLMKDAVVWMKENNYDLSRLGGLRKFYRRFGYHPFPRRYVEFLVGRRMPAGASEVEEGAIAIEAGYAEKIRPFDLERDFESQWRLAEDFSRVYAGSLASERRQVRDQLLARKETDSRFDLVFDEDSRITGYVFADVCAQGAPEHGCNAGLTIGAIGYDLEKPYVLRSLIARVNNHALEKGINRITARLPFDPRIINALADMSIRFQTIDTYGGKTGNMLRIVDLRSLFERLAPELEDRLKASGSADYRGMLEIKIEGESVRLEIDAGSIRVAKTGTPDVQLATTEFCLMRMILGLLSYTETGGSSALLRDLFPRRLVYSGVWG